MSTTAPQADDRGTTPEPDATATTPEVRAPRVRTVVWGLVLAVLGAGVLGRAGGRHVDADVAAIVLVAGAGLALLVGSIVSAVRRRH